MILPLDDKMINQLIVLSRQYRDKDNCIIEILRILINLSVDDELKDKLIEAGSIDVAYNFLTHANPEIQRRASSLLIFLTINEKGRQKFVKEVKIYAVGKIVNPSVGVYTGNDVNKFVRQNCIEIIRNLVELSRGLELVGNLLLSHGVLLIDILQNRHASQVLTKHLGSNKPNVIEQVLEIVALLLKRPDGPAALWNCLNVIPLHFDILANSKYSEKVENLAVANIILFGESHPDARHTAVKTGSNPKFAHIISKFKSLAAFLDEAIPEQNMLELEYAEYLRKEAKKNEKNETPKRVAASSPMSDGDDYE